VFVHVAADVTEEDEAFDPDLLPEESVSIQQKSSP
jgi:hypothetical protein